MFKSIPKSNITIRPFKAYKSWSLDSGSVGYNVVRNLTGSFDNYENTNLNNSLGVTLNEYALNKSIRAIFYNNIPKIIATVVNWDYGKHTSNILFKYDVTSSSGLNTYRYYYDNNLKVYVNEFQNYLNENEYTVNSKGEIIYGSYPNVNTIYGKMDSYGSVSERIINNRYFLIQIPQIYVGEEIKPGSIIINDISTNKTITDDSFGSLFYSGSDTRVGNVFYSNGIIVISYKTENSGEELYNFGTSNFLLNFNSTKTIFENEIFVSIEPHEFNVSTNPTAVQVYNNSPYVKSKFELNSQTYDFRITSDYNKNSKIGFNDYEYSSSIDPTGSYLAPYITTIGLYDEYYNLIAVAKIPSKPKSIPDYPTNFVVRFDT
jgi:hypothetical protein